MQQALEERGGHRLVAGHGVALGATGGPFTAISFGPTTRVTGEFSVRDARVHQLEFMGRRRDAWQCVGVRARHRSLEGLVLRVRYSRSDWKTVGAGGPERTHVMGRLRSMQTVALEKERSRLLNPADVSQNINAQWGPA